MSDKLNEIKQILQNSGLYETLQALEKETKSNRHIPDPSLNFTFHKDLQLNQWQLGDSFGENNFSNKFYTEPLNSNRIHDAKMQFESPYNISKNPNISHDSNNQKTTQNQNQNAFLRNLNENDHMTNDDNFSFGEENASDNEFISKKAVANIKVVSNPSKYPPRAKSDNFINLNQTETHSESNVLQKRVMLGQIGQQKQGTNNLANTGEFNFVPGKDFDDHDSRRESMNSNDPSINPMLYRPRSIRSRQNSLDKESNNSAVLYDRFVNFGQTISVTFSDPCELIRHRGVLFSSKSKPQTYRDFKTIKTDFVSTNKLSKKRDSGLFAHNSTNPKKF